MKSSVSMIFFYLNICIWAAFLISQPIFLFSVYKSIGFSISTPITSNGQMIIFIQSLIGIFISLVSFYLNKVVVKKLKENVKPTIPKFAFKITIYYIFIAFILCLSESISVFGVVLSLATKNFAVVIPFSIVSFVLIFSQKPIRIK